MADWRFVASNGWIQTYQCSYSNVWLAYYADNHIHLWDSDPNGPKNKSVSIRTVKPDSDPNGPKDKSVSILTVKHLLPPLIKKHKPRIARRPVAQSSKLFKRWWRALKNKQGGKYKQIPRNEIMTTTSHSSRARSQSYKWLQKFLSKVESTWNLWSAWAAKTMKKVWTFRSSQFFPFANPAVFFDITVPVQSRRFFFDTTVSNPRSDHVCVCAACWRLMTR